MADPEKKEEKKDDSKASGGDHGGGGKKKMNPFVAALLIILFAIAIAMAAVQLYDVRTQLTWVRDFTIETLMRFIGPALLLLVLGGAAVWILKKK